MYRSGQRYDEMDELIYSIFIDYGISSFPIDEKDLCRKMGVALVPYSAFSLEANALLQKKSKHAFFVKQSQPFPPTIYYNDRYESEGAIRLSILHEIKHYVCEDSDDEEDDLADYFGRHMMCPTAYLQFKGINTPNEIVAFCGASFEAACNASANIERRKEKLGFGLREYEKMFIEQIDPILLEIHSQDKEGVQKWHIVA